MRLGHGNPQAPGVGFRFVEIRRLLAASGFAVLRLVRVAVGPLKLGTLAKGAWRPLSPAEADSLVAPARSP